jgi:starch synthase (maltosyl-transferring)
VNIFRVDNPHTKPLPFWQWLIADVRRRHPDAIFLSEAFTRPAMMYRLAKIGFTQSYTYFTWRNGRDELRDYLIELTQTAPRDFFRPHFFVNTPDINPYYLQTSGRPGFIIRAALAATLSGLWGMYSGFELCEAEPVPGREEYLNSEKYELRPRDWDAEGNIVEVIARLNRIRRENPALHSHHGVRFFDPGNDQVLYYAKCAPHAGNFLLIAVSLDPHRAQEAWLPFPADALGMAAHDGFEIEELMRDQRYLWRDEHHHWYFDPRELPLAIWRVTPAAEGAGHG